MTSSNKENQTTKASSSDPDDLENALLSRLVAPENVELSLSPYLRIGIAGGASWSLDKKKLQLYLKKLVGGKDEITENEWHDFASKNSLMAGQRPITVPDVCYIGSKRWVAVSWHAEWEGELHFGFVNSLNNKYTHIHLAEDGKQWLPKLKKNSRGWRQLFSKLNIQGDAFLRGEETGIKIVSRHTFLKTLISKESMSPAIALFLTALGFFIKNFQMDDMKKLAISGGFAVGCLIFGVFVSALIRHFFVLPSFSWALPQLKD